MKLPQEFTDKMKNLMDEDEFVRFMKSYDDERYYGLRVNTLRVNIDDFMNISPFQINNIPWTRDGFYYNGKEAPGRHPYYHSGLYYIQEPSAMLPAELMDAKPGEKILDLCAAPGGKSVQLAAGLKGEGLLVSNDISSDRIKALIKNLELCGVKNSIVTNEEPAKLVNKFFEFFDGILVDAPCSGEGMFRKDEDAAASWGKFKCEKCASLQEEILESASQMLKSGGRLVYSTCTFSPEEDEIIISNFLTKHSDFEIEPIEPQFGVESGRPQWAGNDERVKGTLRLWPHKVKGEGHYMAKLRKKSNENEDIRLNKDENLASYSGFTSQLIDSSRLPVNTTTIFEKSRTKGKANSGKEIKNKELQEKEAVRVKAQEEFAKFNMENLNDYAQGYLFTIGSNVYSLPIAPPDLSGLKVSKFGLFLGGLGMKGFEPSHSFLLSLKKEQLKRYVDFDLKDENLYRYLRGETVLLEGEKGYTAICCNGFTLGWAKQTGDTLKNLYPKGWRKMS